MGNKHKNKLKAWKKAEQQKFEKSLPFEKQTFFELFRYLDKSLSKKKCQHDFKQTQDFLKRREIDFDTNRSFMIAHGGACDCELLFNMVEYFPEFQKQQYPPKPNKKNKNTREKLSQLNLNEFKIDTIPSPWQLYKIGKQHIFQLGKNKEVFVVLTKALPPSENEGIWQERWEKTSKLKVKDHFEVLQETFENFQMMICKTKNWTPVICWAAPIKSVSWCLEFHTEAKRLSGDLNALKQLIQEINY